MEMKTGSKLIPKLRFKEFESADPWEVKTLGDLGQFYKGCSLSKADLSEQGQPCILYGELYTKYKEVIYTVYSKTDKISNNFFYSQIGDILIPSSGETKEDIARASSLQLENIILAGDMNILRLTSNYSSIFISYILNSYSSLAKIAQGVSVVHLYKSHLTPFKIPLPTLAEQEKIAAVLSSTDRLLELENQKLKHLEAYKKGLLQKLFPKEGESLPQLRFKEFESADPWEVKTLGEVLEVESSKISLNKVIFEKNGYPLYGADGFLGYINFYECKDDYIAIIKDGAGVGRVNFYKGFSSVLGTLNYLILNHKVKHNFSLLFIFYFLYIFNFKEFIVGSGIPHIYFKSYSIMNIPLPTLAEQEKIAAVLSSADQNINQQKQNIQALTLHKKYLLQNLFVQEGE